MGKNKKKIWSNFDEIWNLDVKIDDKSIAVIKIFLF